MASIEWKTKALRQLRKIKDEKTRHMIYDTVEELQAFPNCPNVKKLKDRSEYRLRIGRWRVIFEDFSGTIFIKEVKKRDEQTY
jgi:mRNA-degrading endonuclease RelE of RelBE toxin-antitoxin system